MDRIGQTDRGDRASTEGTDHAGSVEIRFGGLDQVER